jgi:RNA methyltransferase, TrmH family
MAATTSPSNPKIKWIRKLRDRKERESSGLFYIEGLRIVAEAVQLQASFEFLIVAPELLTSPFGRNLLQERFIAAIPVLEVSTETFKNFALKDGPQGIAAVLRQSWLPLDRVELKTGQSWVALDAVQDPGNLGTILRTHDSVGGLGVILLDHATDPYDPTSVRASMGALFSQKLVKTDFNTFSRWKKEHCYSLIGTSGAAKHDYHTFIYPDPCILLMGSEREGLKDHHLQLCDNIIKIPLVGRSDSLNLAIATAVVLYEVYNQKRDRS